MPNEPHPQAPAAAEGAEAQDPANDGSQQPPADQNPSQSASAASDVTPKTVDDLSDEQLADLAARLDDPKKYERQKPSEQPTEQTQGGDTAPAAAAPDAQPGEQPNEEDDDAPGKPMPKNFRFHTENLKLATYLRALRQAAHTNPDVDPAAIAIEVGYKGPLPAAQPAASTQQQPAVEDAPVPPEIQALRDRIAKIDEEQDHAENVEYDAKKVRQLERERSDKVHALRVTEERIAAEQEAASEFNSALSQSRAEALKLAPEAAQDGTLQYDLIVAEISRLEASEPAVLQRPDYPLEILRRCAKKYPTHFPKVAPPAKPAQAAPAQLPAKTPAKAAFRPVGVTVPGNATAVPLDKANITDKLQSMTLEQLTALGDKANERTREKAKR